jgi:ketosteroid isomerase-like protein
MSQENVEVIRAAHEAWNAGDMDAVRETLGPDVIVQTVGDWPEAGPYVGREAVMSFLEQLREPWDADTLEETSDLLHAADRVVVTYVWRGVGHGPASNMEFTVVWSLRKGKVGGIEFFWDHAKALEAAGLRE